MAGMRPAALTVTPAPAQGPAFHADLCEELGTELHLHARAGDLDVVVALPVDATPPTGPFGLTVRPGDLHLFHGETGLRVEPQPVPETTGDAQWQMQPSFT